MSMEAQLQDMGFSELKSKKAIREVGANLEAAVNWLVAHADDPEPTADDEMTANAETTNSESAPPPASVVANSYKCGDCGKLSPNLDMAMMHAERQKHPNIEESNEEIKPLTAEELVERKQKLMLRISEKKAEKAITEQKEAIEAEKRRRESAKAAAEGKREAQMREMREIADERRKQKIEDKKAKDLILDRIKQDREKMKADRGQISAGSSDGTSTPANNSQASAVKSPAVPSPTSSGPKTYTEARLQIRLPTGTPLVHTFGATEPLAAVRLYVQLNRVDASSSTPIRLQTNMPVKIFTEDDMATPLQELGLIPSAVLIVTNMPQTTM